MDVYLIIVITLTQIRFSWFPIVETSASLKLVGTLIGLLFFTNQSSLTGKQPCVLFYFRGVPLFVSDFAC